MVIAATRNRLLNNAATYLASMGELVETLPDFVYVRNAHEVDLALSVPPTALVTPAMRCDAMRCDAHHSEMARWGQ